MGGVKTIEQAQCLPEIESEMFEYIKTKIGGETLIETRIRPLSGAAVEGDDILLFIDKGGRSMKVVHTEDGPAKTTGM